MRVFAELLHNLILSQSRNRKLDILAQYFWETPDPERGYALAILTGNMSFPLIKSSQLKALVLERMDAVLFGYCHDYVGDLAETVAFLWPEATGEVPGSLEHIIKTLQASDRTKSLHHVVNWLNGSSPVERWALVKVITGGLRIGLSERLAKTALAQLSDAITVEEIEELWHGMAAPYTDLFLWLTGKAEMPASTHTLNFRPLMLSHAVDEAELVNFSPEQYMAEWKWDGIRVQLVGNGVECRLYSRSGDDISGTFPDIVNNVCLDAVVDGELLVRHPGGIANFNDLQQRLNRKKPSLKVQQEFPAFIRLYDLLIKGNDDLRKLPLKQRRLYLENWVSDNPSDRCDVSTIVPFTHVDDLKKMHGQVRVCPELRETEGFMLKRLESPYLAGRVKGHWYKWKRNPLSVDLVMMYAQRGHGKRSSFYSDYTFGAWAGNEEGGQILVPVAKAYSGFTDAELAKLDHWVRKHTTRKFGPVREVSQELVLEIEFDSIQVSKRHKSQVAMRFPRVRRIRWDKPAAEADTVEGLKKMI